MGASPVRRTQPRCSGPGVRDSRGASDRVGDAIFVRQVRIGTACTLSSDKVCRAVRIDEHPAGTAAPRRLCHATGRTSGHDHRRAAARTSPSLPDPCQRRGRPFTVEPGVAVDDIAGLRCGSRLASAAGYRSSSTRRCRASPLARQSPLSPCNTNGRLPRSRVSASRCRCRLH